MLQYSAVNYHIISIKIFCFDLYHPVRVVRTGPIGDQYTNRPLLGGTADWGCFHPVTMRNRPVTIDFDRSERRKPGVVLLFPSTIRRPWVISSPRAGRRNVSPCGEKERGDKSLRGASIHDWHSEEWPTLCVRGTTRTKGFNTGQEDEEAGTLEEICHSAVIRVVVKKAVCREDCAGGGQSPRIQTMVHQF
ncbi:hypothetical protein B296_00010932 [Ensete ventricosum]|uniref:Uncharacterized protein n=1 Tax=Ensete ventricosum TaxID=4639 RepID=A0A427B4A1_ENSVE|nr:hypothetical protein B296_00010932 [Ensete ventricosum]